jgi:sarcosine/dimethylglycine N-methyltransferase
MPSNSTDPGRLSASLPAQNKIYDTAAGALWHLAVYEPVHEGREFTNMAGAALLDSIGTEFGLGAGHSVLELWSGTGEVCRYLAGRFDCQITGVELNPSQLDHARLKHRQLPASVQKRVRYLRGDVNTWMPDRPYDLVVAVDSLALMNDPGDALAVAHAALRPGGHLVFADILTGRELSDRVRGTAWEYDGIRPLPQPADTAELLSHLGFVDIVHTDISAAAVDCFRIISGALTVRQRAIQDVCTAEEYQHWCESTEFYLDSFIRRELSYGRFTARRPAQDDS